MPRNSPPPAASRPAGTLFPSGWAEKCGEIRVKKPVYRRQWFRRLVVSLGLLAAGTSTIGGLLLLRWHRAQGEELARQRRGVEAFVLSPAFAGFARETDTQLVAAFNFAALRPEIAGPLLPEIAAAEKARHDLPWPIELAPLPDSAAEHPARVRAALRAATDLLAERGLAFDGTRIADARRVFLRLVLPHARGFLTGHAGAAFPALVLDRGMQDVVLAAYAARGGGTREEVERTLVFYSLVGPALWRELDARPGRSERRESAPRA